MLNSFDDRMAEICYENETVMTKTTAKLMKKTTTTTRRRERSSSQAARRRRMEIRRFKFVSGEQDAVFVDGELKKRRGREATVAASASAVYYETAKEVVVLCESLSSTVEEALPDPDAYPKYGVASVCGRRREMEDAVAVHPFFSRQRTEGFHYCGVYDGHGCSHVAKRCRERLHELVREEVEADDADWEKSMARSFTRMDMEVVALNADDGGAKCRCELQRPDCDAVGSTAVVSVLTPDKIIVANCGDSRAVLCRNGKAIALSSDHKPDRPDELDRIEAAGGRVIYWDGPRVLGVLAMSRAIGDNYLKPYVISKPEVTVTDRVNEDDFLILASDGLWDVVSNETACSVVRMCLRGKVNGQLTSSPERDGAGAGNVVVGVGGDVSDKACEEASLLLTRLALARQSSDNVSVVVVDLRRDT
ncbi:PREDICTED: probable protein phosphatase 2C 78 [Camelina sativa]|uniref:Probable protein phosphatase 2C 78 n=1 Tax=Camelina sativa TaxID=90675 RepID=A0ABM0UNA1_CAMSA|nr:PREDICTED: probable protein phosphatase 2C 78 [Camelina sativa]